MLQVMFLINIKRKIPIQYSGFDVQYHLVSHFDDLDLDQMALVSLAFFKSETKMHNKVIMAKVMRKMIEEAATCTGLTLAMLSKVGFRAHHSQFLEFVCADYSLFTADYVGG